MAQARSGPLIVLGFLALLLAALPAAEEGESPPDGSAPLAGEAPDGAGSAAPASPAPAPAFRRERIANELGIVTVSEWRSSLISFELKDVHPIPLPKWRGGQGADTDTEQPLAVLDLFNPVATAGGPNTDVHNLLINLPGLQLGGPGADESWDFVAEEQSPTTLVLEKRVPEQNLVYRMRYRMAEGRPTLLCEVEVRNLGERTQELQPFLISVNGIHQDDPGNENWDLAVVAHYDGAAGSFDKWSLPDPGATLNIGHPDLEARQGVPASRLDYIGLKSRFFAALWAPGPVTIDDLGEAAAQRPSGETPDAKTAPRLQSIEELTGGPTGVESAAAPIDGSVPYHLAINTIGYAAHRAHDQIHQSMIHVKMFPPLPDQGYAFQLKPGQRLTARWSYTVFSMRDQYLDRLTPIEARVEYTDSWYNFFKILVKILTFFLDIFSLVVVNYGIALILLVFLVKALLHKTMFKQQASMMKLSKLAPELKRLQEKYGNDRQTMAMKQMEMFKKHGVNPMGGCLPMLVIMPIFFALYQTFRHNADMRGTSFLWVADLTLPDQTFFLFMLGSFSVTLNVLPLLYMLVTLWSAFHYKPSGQVSDQQRQIANMMRWMPLIFGVIFYNMPAGLVLYFTCSAIIGTLEMKWIRHKLGMTEGGSPLPM